MGSFRAGLIARSAYATGPVVAISGASVAENATIGTNVGVLSVVGGTGTYTFTLTDTAGGKFAVAGTNGANLNTAAALDYETATSHNITVSATNGGTPVTRTIVITVQDVVEDTTPNAFSFTDVTGATVSTVYESNSITVAGIDGPATMTITGGQYQINGGAWASTSTTVVATNTVKVRGTSSASSSTAVNVVLTIGGVSDTFTITTASSSLPAPVLEWTSGPSVYDPVFTATYVAAVADILTLEIDNNSDFSSLFDSEANPLDAAEVAAGTVTYTGISTLSPGITYYARLKLQRGADSVYSNTVNQTMSGAADTTAPILSSAQDNKTGSTTATITVITDEGNGTLYYVLSSSISPPTAAQVIAGQDHTGAAAMKAGNAAVVGTGIQTINVTLLTSSTTYYAHFAHQDGAGNSSAVASGDGMTTDAGWTPASLTPTLWIQPGNGSAIRTGMFKNNDGVTGAVTTNGDAVAYIPDLSGTGFHLNTNATGTSPTDAPLIQGSGAYPYLIFDGTNDMLRRLAGIDGWNAGATTWCFVFRGVSSAIHTVVANSGNSATTNTVYNLIKVHGTTATSSGAWYRDDAGNLPTGAPNQSTPTNTNVFDGNDHVFLITDSGTAITVYIDGVLRTGIGSYTHTGTFTLNRFSIGARLNTLASGSVGTFWSGRIYGGVIVNGRVIDAAERASLTTYMGALAGLTL